MNDDLMKAQDVFLEKINRICGRFGLNNIMAQLYAVLYFSGKQLSLNEMAERLKISKGSVSVNIRALERYGAVKRVWVKGTRKDYYEAENDISKVVSERIRSMVQRRLVEIDDMISSSSGVLSSSGSDASKEDESAKIFEDRMKRLRVLYDKARSAWELLNTGLLENVLSSGGGISEKSSSHTGKAR